MRLYKVRGGTEKDLYAKQYNIGVGISLGNKWFSTENIVGLVEWSLEHTKEFVVIYVADGIHAINIEVRNRKSPEKAKETALRLGDEILEGVKVLAKSKLTSDQFSKLHFAKWDELFTPAFQEKLDFLNKKYDTDSEFKSAIIELVDSFTSKENRVFSYEDKVKLGSYVIAEFPEILGRTPIKGLVFDAYAYPYDGKLPELVEGIQKGELFLDVRDKVMDTKPKVLLVVR
jgi:tRNA-dependent cyclodipeptide synthase